MKLKTFKPTTPSKRHLIQLNQNNLEKKPFLKKSLKGNKNKTGKGSHGTIISRHKGGGHKKKYRTIEFNRNFNAICIVTTIEYDPFRSANIASVYNYNTKQYFYILAPKNIKIGDIIKSGENAESKNGHSLPLLKIPTGSLIHNVCTKINSSAELSRSAGSFSQLIEKTSNYARIKLNSGEQRNISINCYATLGSVSNELLFLTTKGKAGRSRWLNKRPHVRGVAMNPIDHPHGGGEGKTSGGRSSVTPWGKPTKGGKTSKSRNKFIIVSR